MSAIHWGRVAAAGLAVCLCGGNSAGASPQSEEVLEQTIEEQGKLIRELHATIQQIQTGQKKSEDRLRALEDERSPASVGAGPAAPVTKDWVDRRIQTYQTSDESRFTLSGFGTSNFVNEAGPTPSSFGVSFNPIFQYRLTDKVHFEGEVELELGEAGETAVELEFAQINYLATDWLTLSAGKFLTPINVFGTRLHPSWINKMASRPVIYEKGRGGILGVTSDVGVMASGGWRIGGSESKLDYAVYVSNGATSVGANPRAPVVSFDNTPDANNNKTVGGRIGFLPMPNVELGVSYMTGKTQGPSARFEILGSDAWWSWRGLELRAELLYLDRNLGRDSSRFGYYVQAAYRLSHAIDSSAAWGRILGNFEPVIRFGEINKYTPGNRKQIAVGLDYWIQPSVPLKLTYEFNEQAINDDRLLLQLAFGF